MVFPSVSMRNEIPTSVDPKAFIFILLSLYSSPFFNHEAESLGIFLFLRISFDSMYVMSFLFFTH